MKKRILIVGLGLIGSSLALCIKKGHPNSEIIGFDNQAESTEFAKKTGLIDEIAESLTSGARRAEIIFLCSPVKATLVQLEELNQLSLETALITDVGSTKVEINQLATKLNMKNFIGGHPM
ncbi:prephenate dehydrogenase/arogenate dehydrogenase family protein, partial [Enterococcus faecalis]